MTKETYMSHATEPHPASTVVLLRPDEHGGVEVLMNRRPDSMATYAGVFVFPGGRVETEDWTGRILGLVRGVSALHAQAILGCELQPELCIGYWVAAVRELYEETGIQLFLSKTDQWSTSAILELQGRLARKRDALQKGQIDFASLLDSEGLYCDVSRLKYFFHRVTPEHYPVRFDTRFYLAALPPYQSVLDGSEEVAESLWICPSAALERAESEGYRMMPPTIAVLKTLAIHESWAGLQDRYGLR
jgi:8-oxo-dGTP pyrophosphatase MutT (NUDIX family)